MHNVTIRNFGPITDVKMGMQSDEMIFLLGEQASGKSTIAKLVYYFRTLRDEFTNLVFEDNNDEWREFRSTYVSLLRRKFTGIFGITKTLGDFNILYSYNDDLTVTVSPSKTPKLGFLNIEFSKGLDKTLEKIWKEKKIYKSNPFYINMYRDILDKSKNVFCDDAHIVYIPAGRAFLSHQSLLRLILADEMRRTEESYSRYDIIDAPTRNYISEVNRIRDWYLSPQRNEMNDDDAGQAVSYLRELTRLILKGSYVADKDNDYLVISEGKRIPISYASSGQQEIIWVLNMFFSYAIDKRKCFLLFEEPEAHLHPEAQYSLAKAIANFCNYTQSQVVVTTHSPYILSSFNNLLFAGKCGKQENIRSRIEGIIPSKSWIDESKFSAYMLENGKNRDIKDRDLVMIDLAELDAVASIQDSEFEEILAISSRVG